ncbi:MAG: hypothetical protein M3M96_07860 [Candidatus Eremiobacteraeota bacterium]|nr:hypothetical protein [Candidatus Eremiobacteraeota bacterium]
MTPEAFVTQKERLVRGALLSLLIAGCAHSAPPPDLYASSITATNISEITTRVVESTMPPNDKAAFTEMVSQHHKTPQDLNGKTVREMILEEQAYHVGQRLAKQEQAGEAAHDRAIGKLMTLDVRSHHEQEHQITLTLRIENKTAKTIKSLDCGIEVHDRKGARVGMAEFDFDRSIAPHQTVTFDHAIKYVTFGPDAGTMRIAYLQPKTVAIDLKKVHFTDGSEAGYDD